MRKTLTILIFEVVSLLRRPGFWFGILAIPIITGVIMGIAFGAAAVATLGTLITRQNTSEIQGYVDLANIINANINRSAAFARFGDENSALDALNKRFISGYYLVPADFVTNGRIQFVSQEFSPFESSIKTERFLMILRQDMLNITNAELKRLDNPVVIARQTAISPPTIGTQKSSLDEPPIPIFAAFLIFTPLIGFSSYLMNTVSNEKENRMIEILMSSVTPLQLLIGKMGAMGLMGVAQVLLWSISALGAVRNFSSLSTFIGPIQNSVIFWALVYFVFGYVMYASLMAGLGALMPAAKEAGQYSTFIMIPLLTPIYASTAILANPNSPLSIGLSLFPFTAPVVMVMRLTATSVPFLQLFIGVLLLALCAGGVIWLVSRLFRAQILLAGNTPNLRQIIAAFKS
jgi:ABC-2 type transport system permease protein